MRYVPKVVLSLLPRRRYHASRPESLRSRGPAYCDLSLVTSPAPTSLVTVVQTTDSGGALACRRGWIVESPALPVKRRFGLEAIRRAGVNNRLCSCASWCKVSKLGETPLTREVCHRQLARSDVVPGSDVSFNQRTVMAYCAAGTRRRAASPSPGVVFDRSWPSSPLAKRLVLAFQPPRVNSNCRSI
jgi:hypothetical protein